jgi:thymidine kinase
MKKAGRLTVVCGSMYAGKTEELIRRARRALYARKAVQVFKPILDDRFHESMVVAHMGARHEAVAVSGVAALRDAVRPDTDVVCIEEAQFFEPSLVALCVELADSGKEVVVAGLDQDFRRQPFGPMPGLMCAADEVLKLHAICMRCGNEASHTYRTVDGRPAHWGDPVVLVGATETYEARCRACFRIRGEPTSRSRSSRTRPSPAR